MRAKPNRGKRQPLLALAAGALLSASAVAGWDYHDGRGHELCDAIHRRLNQYSYPDPVKEPNSCAWNAALSYPGFDEPPWIELDPAQHEDLIFKLMRSVDGWSANRPEREAIFRAEASAFIRNGGRVQLWRTRLVSDFRNPNHPEIWTPPGLQNVLQLRHWHDPAPEAALCPATPRMNWYGRVFLVNDDLTDLNQDVGYAGESLRSSSLMLYKARPYLLSRGGALVIDLGLDRGSGPSVFCELRYTHTPAKGK